MRDSGHLKATPTTDVVMDFSGISVDVVTGVIKRLNIGYMWMLLNCLASAAYVSCAVYLKIYADSV